ncbi:Splicing factor, arginine/serine-rich 16 [Pteropus alecto]|uniref:Splicing factor, arginine/serine-rich 16 n=1 Tax=Pteropus alecto TaxID=9402 RepID=L5KN41_PTEAL|nr:Splicing factor, arginine/serine-rich 16 [Pteropus alecto]
MWHEARKHERKLRGMMVDYKKRAERRREYYEKIKKDPAQFLQVHGRACKVHLDSAVALAAESPVNMMPWQGDTNNMIDRFDVRAHLDHIPDYTPPLLTTISPEQESDERKCNYERYRGLVQNDFAGISEEQCLYQIYIDELYGGLQRPSEDEKKKLAEKKASIGYTYEDSTVAEVEKVAEKPEEEESPAEEESNSDEDEVIPDIDVEVDVDELNQEQVADLNKQATTYGMADGDFVRMLRKDKEEAEAIKHAKALEEEKAMYSGRRSRRQRREFREKRLRGRKISPPSYARRDSPTYDPYKRSPSESSSESRSRSRSPSPGREEKITFITSFGGSDEEAAAAAAAAAASGAPGKLPTPPQPGGPAPGRNASARSASADRPACPACSRRSSSSSSSSSASRTSSSRSSSRSTSRSRRGGGYYRSGRHARSRSRSWSRSRSRSRRYSRSRSRGRRHSAGGSRDGHRYSRSPARRGGYGPRRRSRTEPAAGKETGAAKVSKNLELARLTPASSSAQELGPVGLQGGPVKADKKAAQEKMIQQEHERQEREDELRAMARKIRMKRSRSRSRSPHYRH